MSLTIFSFAAAGFSLILSLLVIVSCLLLKLEKIILLFGIYMILMSLVSVIFALVYVYPALPFYRHVLVLIWIIGLSCAYPVLHLVRMHNPMSFVQTLAILMFGVVTCFKSVALIEFFFGVNVLIQVENGIVTVKPLLKYIFIPFSLLGLAVLAILVLLTSTVIDKKYTNMMRILGLGMLCMLPFEYVDLLNTFFLVEPLREPIYVYNVGVLVFALFFCMMVVQYIREKMFVRTTAKTLLVAHDDLASQNEYLLQIFQKAVKKITSKKYYADDSITIEVLARLLNENRNELSRAINTYYQGNFSNFMNSFRVEALKRLLEISEMDASILDLGFQVGFKSKTSINRIFFKFTNSTPSEYRNSILNTKESDFSSSITILKK